MNTQTQENDELTTEQLLALKLEFASETLAEMQEKLTKLATNSNKPERALELLHKFQGKIEALDEEYDRIISFEEEEGYL